jgi:hypothetical protein
MVDVHASLAHDARTRHTLSFPLARVSALLDSVPTYLKEWCLSPMLEVMAAMRDSMAGMDSSSFRKFSIAVHSACTRAIAGPNCASVFCVT